MATCKMSRLLPDMSAHHRLPREGGSGGMELFLLVSRQVAGTTQLTSRASQETLRLSLESPQPLEAMFLVPRLLFPASANCDHKTQHAASSTHVAAPRCSRNIHSSGWPCGCTMGPFHPPTPFFGKRPSQPRRQSLSLFTFLPSE